MDAIQNYLNKHRKRFLDELLSFLRIPSIGTMPKHAPDTRGAAVFVRDQLAAAGLAHARLIETASHPLVYGEKIIDSRLPTVLVYGHYDVQPAEPEELWDTPPFEPVIRDEKIYARGASDDKGQVYMHIKAFETLWATQELPCNVKFLIEGEEENGSEGLATFLADKRNCDLLRSDVVLISDTALLSMDQPSITIGTRGIIYFEVTVLGPNRDLHSGAYGGAVANPINVLCSMLGALHDEHHRITIPKFYDNVRALSAQERADLNQTDFNLTKYQEELGIEVVMGEAGYNTTERASIRPSLDVNGIWGGYTAAGSKTVLPAQAQAKLSMRLVPYQDAQEVSEDFVSYFPSLAPAGVQVKIRTHYGGSNAIIVPTDSMAFRAAYKAFETVWHKRPLTVIGGYTLPILPKFQQLLGCDIVMMGFSLRSDAAHAPNEHFGLVNFFKGIDTVIAFYKHLTRVYTQ